MKVHLNRSNLSVTAALAFIDYVLLPLHLISVFQSNIVVSKLNSLRGKKYI